MKKVLLTTTALMMLGGVATAGSSTMSGSIALTYGAWGTGETAGGADGWTSEADLNIAATSDSGSLTMSGTLEIDEDGNQDHGIGKDDWGLYAFFKCSNKGKKYFVQIRQYGKATN